jgi:CxxC-x17-CxxC domain-containing protein
MENDAQNPAPQSAPPVFKDVTLFDRDTNEPFIFTAKEQEFFWRQGFTNVPRYSPERRKEMREKKAKGKPLFNVVCKICGRVGKVLVEPPDLKDIYCETCFNEEWAAYLEKHPDIKAAHEKADAEITALIGE